MSLRSAPLVAVLLLASVGAAAQTSAPEFTKVFNPSTIGPGSVSTLTFTIANPTSTPVTAIAFEDVLPAGMTIAAPSKAATTCAGGRGGPALLSAPDGGGTISLSDASVPGSASCTVTVDVTAGAIDDDDTTYENVSGALTSSAGTQDSAMATLTVAVDRPGFSKSFSPASVVLGGRSTLTFTIDNSLNASDATYLAFSDNFPVGMVVANPTNAVTDCGAPSIPPTLTAPAGANTISLTANGDSFNPALPEGATCTVSVDVVTTAVGDLGNTSDVLNVYDAFQPTLAGKASAVLGSVVGTLALSKSFLFDPVAPGGTVPLEFELRNIDRGGRATDLAFSDDLDLALSGLVANTDDFPLSVCDGTLDSSDGGMTLEFSGGELDSGDSCTFAVDVEVPAGAPLGAHTNVTSGVTGLVNGEDVAGLEATATLFLAPVPILTKTFTTNPVAPGAVATLEFSITNSSTLYEATNLSFTDVLTTIVPSPLSVALPASGFCGAGSTLSVVSLGTSGDGLRLSMGSLPKGDTCTFSVGIDIPGTVFGGDFLNTTSEITGRVDGQTVTGAPASDVLTIVQGPQLSKLFLDDPVVPGEEVTLRFAIEFATEGTDAATDIAFSDDFDATLDDLVASAPGTSFAACGGTATLAVDGSSLALSGGSLAPDASCEFTVDLTVPATAAAGSYPNTTTALTSTVGTATLTGATASDVLDVTQLSLAKAFTDDPVAPGGTVTLEFTLTNESDAGALSGIVFTDNLGDVLPEIPLEPNDELVATGLPLNVCGGTLSANPAGTFLTFVDGSLAAGTSCDFAVSLTVPAITAEGIYANTTSGVSASFEGSPITAPPASDQLVVATAVPTTPPTLAAAFVPAFTSVGGLSTLTLTIDNSLSGAAASGLAVTATLAPEVVVATPSDAASTCGGTVTGASGSNSLALSGGAVASGASCTVTVSVVGTEVGMFMVNTTDLSSSNGTSPAASAKLTVEEPVVSMTKTDALDDTDEDGLADQGETISYSILIEADGEIPRSTTFSDTPDANTTLVAGSIAVDAGGTVATGNGTGDTSVEVAFANFVGPATLSFDVTVNAGYTEEDTEVCNQGTFSGDFADILTDDPDVTGFGATCTALAPPNRPPVADAGGTGTAECTGAAGAAFALDGSGSSDADGDVLTYSWTGPFPEGGGTVTGVAPTVTLPLGESTVTLTVTDPYGESDTDDIVVTVEDTTAPTLTVGASPLTLWPPNHQYVTVPLTALLLSASDICDTGISATATVVTQVSSDEPENANGDGNTDDDMVVAPTCDSVDVRVERQGSGNGRVYVLGLGLADASGNVATGEYEVRVPKSPNKDATRDAPVYTVFGCPAALLATGSEDGPAPDSATTSLEEGGEEVAAAAAPQSRVIPEAFALGTAFPNPMSRSARVRYDVPVASAVRLAVYDALGRQVVVLVDGPVEAGSHEAVFYAHRLPAGTYLVRFTSEAGFAETRPVTVLR